MHDEQTGGNPAHIELRRRLADGLALARLNQTQLAARTGLGRTTVSQALSSKAPVPSRETVAALARGLTLPVEELLALRQEAAADGGDVSGERSIPGRPIVDWDPHDLEVHPAGYDRVGADAVAPGTWVLPGYVQREHDRVLATTVGDVAAGSSRIVVLVGSSSTGKTRACWEAVQPLADQGWRLWHPFDPTASEAALKDLQRVGPCTVVWLNEAQHYFGDPAVGERIAAAVHHLLIDPERGPVLVLGTLWPEYAREYTALSLPGTRDQRGRVRELLSGHTLTVPDAFDARALAEAAALANSGDELLADALARAGRDGRVAQDLAGAPELLIRYQRATPAARALLDAALDARRLGVGPHLPQVFLIDAAPDYLTQSDYDQLTDDWAERAFAELAEPVHGKQAALRRAVPRPQRRPPALGSPPPLPVEPRVGPVFRLADYLEEHGRTGRRFLCPPASFWYAAHAHLTDPDDLGRLAEAADDRHRLQWAHYLEHRAADCGSTAAMVSLSFQYEVARDMEGAQALAVRAASHGNTKALRQVARTFELHGDQAGAEALLRLAADHGDTDAMVRLAQIREAAGDRDEAEALAHRAASNGNAYALLIVSKSGSRNWRNLSVVESLKNLRELVVLDQADEYLSHAADAGIADDETVGDPEVAAS